MSEQPCTHHWAWAPWRGKKVCLFCTAEREMTPEDYERWGIPHEHEESKR